MTAGDLLTRITDRTAEVIERRTSRRGFMGRSAMVGSAVMVGGSTFVLRPGTAYAALCSCPPGAPSSSRRSCGCGDLCCSGYTEFCCHIYGQNYCPDNTLLAGWWKVDNSTYCDGAARYYMDCNKAVPDCACGSSGVCRDSTPCQCRTCDSRRDGCTVFRYGNCNNDVACVGPIVCRVVTCTQPWELDPGCSTVPRTDPATATHHRACLETPIEPAPEDLAWARAIHVDYLGATPTDAQVLDLARRAAVNANRVELARSFAASGPYLATVLDGLYRRILARPVDDAGLAYWTRQIQAGATVTAAAAFIYGSDEFFNRTGTVEGFVADLYESILERRADTDGLAYWVGVASSPERRPRVGGYFFGSVESRRRRVDELYRRFLNRAPDDGGLAHWTGVLASGDDLALATFLSGSDEYLARAVSRFS